MSDPQDKRVPLGAQNTPMQNIARTEPVPPTPIDQMPPTAPDQKAVAATFQHVAANAGNAPVEARVPLMNYTVYLLAVNFEHAKSFAWACLNNMQPWTFIEGPETLKGLWNPTILVFSDYTQRADADAVLVAAQACSANLTANPTDLTRFGPPTPLPQEGDPDISGSLPGPVAAAVGAQAQVYPGEAALRDGASPMDIPPRA